MARKLLTTILAAALLAPAALYAEEDAHINFVKRVQIRLHELGFDPGLINGELGGQTQAALAQFQQSWLLPVTGTPDAPTLFVLDVPREIQPSTPPTAAATDASAATDGSVAAGGSAPAGR